MSAIAPYRVCKDESPKKLRLLLARNPAAISLYRNVVHGMPIATKVFVPGSASGTLDEDDSVIEFLVDNLVKLSLLKREEGKLIPTYTDIVINRGSFTDEEARIYAHSVMAQGIAALASNDKPVNAQYFVGSLSTPDFADMSERQNTLQNEFRDKPDGEISYVTAFICKQV